MGVMIVQRGRRYLGLTAEGERVLVWAQQTLASLSYMREDASAAKIHHDGHAAAGGHTHDDDGRGLSDGPVLCRVSQYPLLAGRL